MLTWTTWAHTFLGIPVLYKFQSRGLILSSAVFVRVVAPDLEPRRSTTRATSVSARISESSAAFMSKIGDLNALSFDPFKESELEDPGSGTKDYVHVRIQQRNGRKCLTTVQGLHKDYNYNKILKDFKREFCCNGTVVEDQVLGKVIQLQGDQRKNVSQFLINAGLVKKDKIKIHGF